ncbi:MAG: DTW domain-containing protein [Oligoflexales bacterium]
MPKMLSCPDCNLFVDICICSQIMPIVNATKIAFVVNRKESFKITNTAKLANRILRNSELHIYGKEHKPFDFDRLSKAREKSFLLFPFEGSKILCKSMLSDCNAQLIVPDGNWKQARKIARKIIMNLDVEPVRLSKGMPSEYLIRFHPDPEKVATIEAVNRALSILEPKLPLEHLMGPFRLMRDGLLGKCGKLQKEVQ